LKQIGSSLEELKKTGVKPSRENPTTVFYVP